MRMKYIINNSEAEEGVRINIDFSRYRTYIESIKKTLPAHIYAFGSNPCYFDFESPSSLHDAWLETLTVREIASGERNEIRRLEICLCLLGPFHDRKINLRYNGVTQYSFIAPPRYGESRYEHTAHGDLLIHEIRLGHSGLFVHELLFESDATLLIECADIIHSEEMISSKTARSDGKHGFTP
jgi:hypothetical protein